MARIRTVKPEFFTSESVLSVSPLARLFFIGLWCEADRDGRLKWKPKTLKFRYLPADSVNIEKLCTELEQAEMIVTYTIDNNDYCEIPSFKSHQVINNREKESELPSRDSDASTTRESGRKEGREGKERKGTTRFTPPTLEEVIQYNIERKNFVDANKFINHYSANGWMRGKAKIKDWKACIRTWEQNDKENNKKQTPKEFSQ